MDSYLGIALRALDQLRWFENPLDFSDLGDAAAKGFIEAVAELRVIFVNPILVAFATLMVAGRKP